MCCVPVPAHFLGPLFQQMIVILLAWSVVGSGGGAQTALKSKNTVRSIPDLDLVAVAERAMKCVKEILHVCTLIIHPILPACCEYTRPPRFRRSSSQRVAPGCLASSCQSIVRSELLNQLLFCIESQLSFFLPFSVGKLQGG